MTGLVLGLGCRPTCTLATLEILTRQLLEQSEHYALPLRAIACWEARQHHEGLNALANLLEVPLEAWPTATLAAYTPLLSHRSPTLYHHTGLWGVAEAAALASAEVRCKEKRPTLLVTRQLGLSREVTGAVARCIAADSSTLPFSLPE